MRHLVLVGMMGAGKTTVGEQCAKRLGRAFVDTDDVVETLAGMGVAEIFATFGEARFRELEVQAVRDVCASPEPLVIACGGGAVLDPGNRRGLHESGVVVWLRAPVTVLGSRLAGGAGRPLLTGDPDAALRRLATVRADAYGAAADVVVETGDLDLERVTDAVLRAYREHEERGA